MCICFGAICLFHPPPAVPAPGLLDLDTCNRSAPADRSIRGFPSLYGCSHLLAKHSGRPEHKTDWVTGSVGRNHFNCLLLPPGRLTQCLRWSSLPLTTLAATPCWTVWLDNITAIMRPMPHDMHTIHRNSFPSSHRRSSSHACRLWLP